MARANTWRLANPERHNFLLRENQLQRKFGLTVADYDKMVQEHRGACAICRLPCKTGRRLAIDHCHETGLIRGLLCHACNTGLGKFADNPERLKAAVDYLLQFMDGNVIHTQEKGRTIPKAS